jgi:hypothetical protein
VVWAVDSTTRWRTKELIHFGPPAEGDRSQSGYEGQEQSIHLSPTTQTERGIDYSGFLL